MNPAHPRVVTEHRCSKRHSIQFSVAVDSPGLNLTSANICDISLGGMFVQTDGLKFPLEAEVFVAFASSPNSQHDRFGLETMVVRHTPSGVGLMFLETETRIVRALKSVRYGTPPLASTLPAEYRV
jgi:c-di-GMP-binding flagellar brake protein YcgR